MAAGIALDRLRASMGSNEVSASSIVSESGKQCLAEILADAASGDFDPVRARNHLLTILKLGQVR